MHVNAPAKLNLFLEVLAREESGYHQLETLFCALELADEIEVATGGDSIALAVEGAELGPPETNLVQRAARAYRAAVGEAGTGGEGVQLRLVKRIPAGAGLGGGSSDAAATLRALDALNPAPLGNARLLEIAAGLGSDVPFFLCGSPCALAWGRGGRLLPLNPLPAADVLLLVPEEPVATAAAFERLARERGTGHAARPRVLRLDRIRDWDDVAWLAHNDFESVVFEALPRLRAAKSLLAASGAAPALLSGSGGTVYGVFRERARLEAAERAAARELPGLRQIRTRTAAPPQPLPFG